MVYLDCNATAPIDPRVAAVTRHFLEEDFGNAGSRTHDFGARAKRAVQRAREQIASLVCVGRDEVLFTSGATESNNLAILGLAPHGKAAARTHIITTAIEHKAILEPIDELRTRGFSVSIVHPATSGDVDPCEIERALRPDTLLVSVMHVNNETGVVQPLSSICEVLKSHPAFLHVDAAQGFGKEPMALTDARIDLISVSGHKIYGPKGIGALVARRRGHDRLPLTPLFFGGGQERGLRPGTLPVPLIAGFGLAAELASTECVQRATSCRAFRDRALHGLAKQNPAINGDLDKMLPHTLNLSFAGLDSEAVMLAWKHDVAVSNGSACTSQSYEPSHVLKAMGLPTERIRGAIRLSWCHMTPDPDWAALSSALDAMR